MTLTKTRALAGATALLSLALLAGCDRPSHQARQSAAADASAVVVGKAPAEPTGDPAGTTPVAADGKELTKTEETRKMPLEGQENSFMTESKVDSQRTGKVDAQTARRGQ